MKSIAVELDEKTTTNELLNKIDELNKDDSVHGILLQHPVPSHIDERKCLMLSIRQRCRWRYLLGFGSMTMQEPAYGSCTPAGIMRMLEHYDIPIEGKHAVVVGRSPILGKPMAMMLLNENATVTICHSRTKNLPAIINEGDILVGAVGVPKLIKSDWIKPGAVVIDAGYHPQRKMW